MKQLLKLFIASALVAFATQGLADPKAGEAVAKKSDCMLCHKVDGKLVGPAFKDVAAKYKGDKAAAAKLADKVKKGGSGVWGTTPMMAHPNLSDDDLKSAVEWVLAQ
jgi:cytochrome c